MSGLEKKWWYAAVVSALTSGATLLLMHAAGLPGPSDYSLAQWTVYGLCMAAIWRCLSGLGWLAVLLVSPKTIPLPRQAPKQP